MPLLPFAATAFIAKSETDEQLSWIKDVAFLPGGFNSIVQIFPIRTGGFLALVANVNGASVKSAVIKMDNDGKQLSKTDLTTTLFPTCMTYDDISETVAVAAKGSNGNYNSLSDDDTVLETVVIGQKQSSTSPTFKLKGKIADVVKAASGYILVCNYTNLTVDGKTYTSKSDVAAVFTSGSQITANVCESKDEMRAIKAFRINAGTINVTGAYDNLDSNISSSEKPAYILLSGNGKLIYKN